MKRLLLIALALAAFAYSAPQTPLEAAVAARDAAIRQTDSYRRGYVNQMALNTSLVAANKALQVRIAALEAGATASAWEARIDARCPTCRAAIDEALGGGSTEEWTGNLITRSRAGVSVPEIPPGTAALYLLPSSEVVDAPKAKTPAKQADAKKAAK